MHESYAIFRRQIEKIIKTNDTINLLTSIIRYVLYVIPLNTFFIVIEIKNAPIKRHRS